MTKSKDPLSTAVDLAFGVASSALSMAAQQVRTVTKGNSPETSPEADQFSHVDIDRLVDIAIEREGLVRQEELVSLRKAIAEVTQQLAEVNDSVVKLRKKMKRLEKDNNDE